MKYGYKHLVYGHKVRVTRRHQSFQGYNFHPDWSLGIAPKYWVWIIAISLVAGLIKTLQA
jgi:hypothetical protein